MSNAPLPQTLSDRTALLAGLGVLVASICFGLVPLFTRGLLDQGIPSFAIAYYRYILAGVFLLPVLIRQRHEARAICWGLAAGLVMGLGWIGYVQALATVPVSTVGVLYMTYPVFTVVLAWVLFRDRPSGRAMSAAGLIVLAAVIAGGPQAVTAEQLPALIMAMAAPFGFGFGITVLVHRLSRITPLARISAVSLGSIIGLTPLMVQADPSTLLPSDAHGWMLVVGIGLLTALVPQLIYTVCSPLIGTARTAVIGSIELPTMFAVGVLAFGETLTREQAIAGALVVVAIVLTRSRKARGVATTLSKDPG